MQLNEILEKRKSLSSEISKLDKLIKEFTDLPNGWTIDPDHGYMSGGVTLHGFVQYDECTEPASVCVYDKGLFIRDEELHEQSVTISREAIQAALKIYDIKERLRKEELQIKNDRRAKKA